MMDGLIDKDSFAQQLQSLWSIESMLVEAMPRMIQKVSNLGLQKNLALHFEETRQHKVAIEAICKGLDIDPTKGEPYTALQNILQEGEQAMLNQSSGDALDNAIIEAAQKIEQCEIAAYEPAGNSARELGHEGIAKRLFLTLEEERQSETKLKFLQKSLFSERALIGERQEQAAS
ncbi:MAG: DUF892 family protein [Chitinophagaceae bacterium]|nr:MAG: DUF892 family protein [Chitinophagaceae bacterium]